ncbi:MAG: hypothetical protein ACFHWZ_05365 [Phycisphaerales bacterium]
MRWSAAPGVHGGAFGVDGLGGQERARARVDGVQRAQGFSAGERFGVEDL